MKLFKHAMTQAHGLTSQRAIRSLLLAIFGTLLPTAAFASEGENVKLVFSSSDRMLLWISLGLGVVALITAALLRSKVLSESPGSEKMQEVGKAIREGALAYLKQQIRTMLYFVGILAIGLFALYFKRSGWQVAVEMSVCFVGGVAASYIAGFTGMLTAVDGNMRTANAALKSYKSALEIAFKSGAVAGMVTVGMGLIGASLILLFAGERATTLLIGFGFGGSLAALFMRVGGGIFTKAADVGADLVGKVEAGIPEDDPRNPATIADNVGDNVGDCAGMAADIFESYEVTLVAAIVLGAATYTIFDESTWMRLILFALMARGVGVLASIYGIFSVKGKDDIDADPLACIRSGFYRSAGVAAVLTFVLAYLMMGGNHKSTIQSTELKPIENLQLEQVQQVFAIRDAIATRTGVKYYEVKPEDLAANSTIKALGMDDPQNLAAVVRAKTPDTQPKPTPKGYSAITNFTDNNPVLSYAVDPQFAADQQDPTKQPPRYTVGSLFGAKGQDQLVVAHFHLVADMPGTPPQPATPNSPARPAIPGPHKDITGWTGPLRKKDIDAEVANFKKGSPGSTLDVTETLPVTAYANKDGDLLVGIPSQVDRPGGLNTKGFAYWKLSNEQMNDLVAKKQTPPPGENTSIVIAKQQEVPWWTFALAITFGIIMAFFIELLTDYYVSTHKNPVKEVAGVSNAGPAPMIIQGFAYAMESSVFMVFAICAALITPLFIFPPGTYGGYILSFYGIALVGLGLLTTTGYILAMDTFGPISDNAQGVYEMSGEGHDNVYGTKAVQRLDAAGNTTKALTKGFAITTAVVAAVALFHSYLESANLDTIGLRLDIPEIFLGMLIGAAAPFLFSSSTINAVGRASFQLINEVRRQFRSDPGIMAGTSKPDYAKCVAIVTAAAQRELLGPGILAIALPAAVGFGFSIGKAPTIIGGLSFNLTGAEALGGFLAGAIASGQLLAVVLANSGGMWDNAKKLIEDGLYGGKGTDAHRAGVVVDTVGDPFKDTAGPALNPLIKVMNLVALLLAEVVIMPLSNGVLSFITLVSVGALAVSIYLSKKGSMSSEMAKATQGQPESIATEHVVGDDAIAAHVSFEAVPEDDKPKKKLIKVEEEPSAEHEETHAEEHEPPSEPKDET